MPGMSFKGKAAQAVFDALTKPARLPKTGIMEGNLLRAARAIQPGKGVRLEAESGESYTLIRSEDFDYICEKAGMRAKEVTSNPKVEP